MNANLKRLTALVRDGKLDVEQATEITVILLACEGGVVQDPEPTTDQEEPAKFHNQWRCRKSCFAGNSPFARGRSGSRGTK